MLQSVCAVLTVPIRDDGKKDIPPQTTTSNERTPKKHGSRRNCKADVTRELSSTKDKGKRMNDDDVVV
jgi:hypothetical protein